MLPDDPVLRGRLFRAARDLLGWTQARVAGEAGVTMGR
jgi:transcriptional regulator with XRE-family HTH domain